MRNAPFETTRRRCLVATAGLAVALAGCADGGDGGGGDGGDGGGGDGGTPTSSPTPTASPTPGGLSGSDYPAVDGWLTETEVGGADETYDGTVLDRRGRDSVEVAVGASGNGGNFAFDPSAVAVSPGTTVRWVWTGEGGAHNVAAKPEEQIGESDYEFSSGEPLDEEGHTYERTLDEPGVALYHCAPHLSLGMKGAVVVTE